MRKKLQFHSSWWICNSTHQLDLSNHIEILLLFINLQEGTCYEHPFNDKFKCWVLLQFLTKCRMRNRQCTWNLLGFLLMFLCKNNSENCYGMDSLAQWWEHLFYKLDAFVRHEFESHTDWSFFLLWAKFIKHIKTCSHIFIWSSSSSVVSLTLTPLY